MNMTPTEPGWHRGDWMQTFTGKKFYPTNPNPDDIDPVDIAHALSMLCRYAGHVDRFYSVAEHAVKMSRWFVDLEFYEYDTANRRTAIIALLHDATEAYCVDVPRPLKIQLPDYQAAERKIEHAVWTRFDLGHMVMDSFTYDAVKIADTRILLDERAALMPNTRHPWGIDSGEFEPLGVTIEAWSPERAEREFLAQLEYLGVS